MKLKITILASTLLLLNYSSLNINAQTLSPSVGTPADDSQMAKSLLPQTDESSNSYTEYPYKSTSTSADGSSIDAQYPGKSPTSSSEQWADNNTPPTPSSTPQTGETTSSSSTTSNNAIIVHLTDASSGKELATMSLKDFNKEWNWSGNSELLGKYYPADWQSDVKGAPMADNAYTYPVITAAEYQKEVNAATVTIRYIDSSTGKKVDEIKWTQVEGAIPDTSKAPDGYTFAKKPDEAISENGLTVTLVYVTKIEKISSSSTSTPATKPSSSTSSSNSSILSKNISTTAQIAPKMIATAPITASSTKTLPKTGDNTNQSVVIMLIGMILSAFAYVLYQIRKKIAH